MRGFTVLLICVGILCGCSHNVVSVEKIEIKSEYKSEITIEELFGDAICLPVKADGNEPLIGMVSKAYLGNNHIYISDSKAIYVFDKNGSHKHTVSRIGRSEQEYTGIMDFCVQGQYIYVLDRNKKIVMYDHTGRYVSSANLDFYPASLIVSDGQIILTSAYQEEGDKFNVYDSSTLNRKYSFAPINENQITWRHLMWQSNFYEYDDELFFHEPMNNTIYHLEDTAVTPVRYIDLFGRNAPEDFWNSRFDNIMAVNMEANKNGYCFGIPVYSETDELICFTYRDGADYRLCRYSKKDGSSMQSDNLLLSQLSLTVPVANLVFSMENETDQMIVLSGALLDSDIKESVLNVSSDYDNLVFVIKN